jgi:hypothetical protein
MTTLIFILCIIGAIWYWKIEKEKRTIKAYTYLKIYGSLKSQGKENDEASILANGYVDKHLFGREVDSTREEKWTDEAAMHLRCGGNSNETIALARRLGFSK